MRGKSSVRRLPGAAVFSFFTLVSEQQSTQRRLPAVFVISECGPRGEHVFVEACFIDTCMCTQSARFLAQADIHTIPTS